MSLYTVTFEPGSDPVDDDSGDFILEKDQNVRRKKKKKLIQKQNQDIPQVEIDMNSNDVKPPTPPSAPQMSRPFIRKSRTKRTHSQSEENTSESHEEDKTKTIRKRRRKAKTENNENDFQQEESVSSDSTRTIPKPIGQIQNPIIQKPACLPEEKIVTQTYRIERTKTSSIRDARTHFQIYHGGIPLYHCKIKSHSYEEVLAISKGNESHFSSKNFEGYLRTDSNLSNFCLRVGNEFGDERMVIRYFEGKRENEPRTAIGSIFLNDNTKQF